MAHCTSENWDTDRIFENKRLERERFASRNPTPTVCKPVASVLITLTDLKGAAATLDTYDNVLDAVPEPLTSRYVSATEGFRLDFGSDVEAEAAETKAKNVVMNFPTVKIVTKRVQGENTQSPAINTPQKSTEAGSASPTTPTTRLFTSPPSSCSAEAAVAFGLFPLGTVP